MSKLLLAAAATALMAAGTANAAFIDLTKRHVGTSVDSNSDGIQEFIGVPNPTPDPFQIKIGLAIATFDGDPDGINARQLDEGGGSFCTPVGAFECDTDGLGIGDDEITFERSEKITITFNVPVFIDNLFYLDLFRSSPDLADTESAFAEFFTNTTDLVAATSLSTFATAAKHGAGGNDRGFYAASLAPLLIGPITKIVLTAGPGKDDMLADFALAGLEFRVDGSFEGVPIPGALPLFLAGIGGIALARRRRNA